MRARRWMQIAAVASAVGLTGTAIAHDTDRMSARNDATSASATDNHAAQMDSTPSASGTATATDNGAAQTGNNAAQMDSRPSASGMSGAPALNGSTSSDTSTSSETSTATPNAKGRTSGDVSANSTLNGSTPAATGSTSTTTNDTATGTTQGSTMTSPRSDALPGASGAVTGSGSAATSIAGTDRLGKTNSENFDQWMSDYAAQHDGRITRQEFLDEMGNRWDEADTQGQGYLTPGQVREIFIFEESAPATSPGSDMQSGTLGSQR